MTIFQRFLAAGGLANLADGVASLAWVWVASMLTRDAGLIAMVPVALRLPWVIFAIPAGLITDRVDRRRMVVAMDCLRAAAFGAAALVIWAAGDVGAGDVGAGDVPDVGPLFLGLCLAALTVGIAEVFRDNAAQTLLPELVADAQLERANARLWTMEAVCDQMLGPALGAFLLGLALGLPFAVNALCYGVAALLMAQLRGDFRPKGREVQSVRAALVQALAYLRGKPVLLLLAVVTGFWNLFSAAMFFGLVLHGQENLGLSAQDYGFVLMGMAAGGIAAGLVGAPIIARLGAARVMAGTLFSSSLVMLAFPLMPNGWGLALCFFALELGGVTWNIVSVSLRQRMVPDALRGRVNSVYRLLAWGMIPLGTGIAGAMVGWFEPALGRGAALAVPLWAAGIGQMLVCLAVLRPLLRRLAATHNSV